MDVRGVALAAPRAPSLRENDSHTSWSGDAVCKTDRHREGALGAIFLGHVEALQRSWVVAAPLTNAVAGRGFLLWRLPEFVVAPRRLFAGVLGHPSDGASARGKHVPSQRAQALDLAPSPCLHCLTDPPLQGPYPTVTRCPVDRVPARCRQARGRL